MAFANAFDMNFEIKKDIKLMCNKPVSILRFSKSLSSLDVIKN